MATVAVLFVLNGGYLLCLFPVAGRIDDLWLAAPVMPYILDDRPRALRPGPGPVRDVSSTRSTIRLDPIVSRLLACVVSLVGYGLAARGPGHRGDRRLRPRRRPPRRPPGFSTELAEGVVEERDEPEAVEVGPDS